MSVEEIERAITALPRPERAALYAWVDAQRNAEWDSQIAADVEAGRLDTLIEKAREHHRAGRTTRLGG